METLERSRVCRLCGKHTEMTIDIFDKGGNHVKKINSVLPILVHEMDLLPKHICHPCNYKLQEFHKFYEDCLKTDANLKGQLSWMQGSMKRVDDRGVPMVQINNIIIKTEPPDYDEEIGTNAIFHSRNFNNYLKNNCNGYPERIFTSAKIECSHCGCYCGNKNVRTRENEKNNNEQCNLKDTIKRNLFATEIFNDKKPKIQTKIPVRKIPQKIVCRQNSGRRNSPKPEMAVVLNKMTVETNKMATNANKMAVNASRTALNENKMATLTNKMAARTLRPRKSCSANNAPQFSAPPVATRSLNISNDEKITTIEPNTLESVAIKLEVLDDSRSLRPRIDVIDYSDSKRKNPLARTDDRKRQRSSENVIKSYLATPIIPIKIEPEVISCSSESQERANITIKPRRTLKKPIKISHEEFLKSPIKQILGSKNVKTDFSGRSRAPLLKITVRKNLMDGERQNYRYLRSQRVQLRNGKMMTSDSIMEKPMKIHNVNSGSNATSIKLEKEKLNDEKMEQTSKHRDCDMCSCRFASVELYMLHHCYANKRH